MLSVEHLSSLLVECKNMCQKLQNAIDTISGSYQTEVFFAGVTGHKYKTNLKLTPEKNKVYIKFHNKHEVTDTALNINDVLIKIQHSGYDLDVHDPNSVFDSDTFMYCQRVSPDSNIYVGHLEIKPMVTDEGKTKSIIRLRDDTHATFDWVMISIYANIVNPDVQFITFSSEPLI